jgi:hypothetical protein
MSRVTDFKRASFAICAWLQSGATWRRKDTVMTIVTISWPESLKAKGCGNIRNNSVRWRDAQQEEGL